MIKIRILDDQMQEAAAVICLRLMATVWSYIEYSKKPMTSKSILNINLLSKMGTYLKK